MLLPECLQAAIWTKHAGVIQRRPAGRSRVDGPLNGVNRLGRPDAVVPAPKVDPSIREKKTGRRIGAGQQNGYYGKSPALPLLAHLPV
jgi:hypothetical protein